MSEHQPGRDLAARAAALRAHDPDFTASVPSPDVAEAVRACEGGLVATIETAVRGYADRPALARRAERIVRDTATGRSTRELLPAFETVSYAELWQRVGRLATAWADPAGGGLRPGDFVATLGFTGVDYAVIDLACMYLGTVSVPLATGAPAPRLAPVVAETEPRLLAADIGSLDAAVDTVLASDSVERLVVFDCDLRVDDHREALRAAAEKLDGRAAVAPLADELRRGAELPRAAPHEGDPERLAGLIYTSGSTGTPKGAIYTAAMITRMWQKASGGMAAVDGIPVPTIVLHYMPMSHVNGRSWLVSALACGGIGHFAARGDLSTLFDDIRLSRPTVLSLVPRICDMVHQRHLLEAERRTRGGTARAEAEAAAREHVRDGMLGGRIMSALCGSAPLSAAMHTFMGDVLGTKIIDCYGSTETTRAVIVDQQVRRPPILDYRLVDVPELGYFATDRPHPRGELRLKSTDMVPGYYRQPEVTARTFDEDGYYRTGDVFAEVGPDRLVYVDRINNVVKLSQGEFVAVSKLEALYSTSPLVAQVYVYGSSEQAFLLAVVVPDRERLGRADDACARAAVLDSMRELAHGAGLYAYEIPQDVLIERQPFGLANGLLSGVGKLLRPALKEHYGARLEQLYADIAAGRAGQLAELSARDGAVEPLEAVRTAVQITLGHPAALVRPEATFAELGGDSLSAHTFATVLERVFDTEVPVQAVLGPSATLARIADRLGRGAGAPSPGTAPVGREPSGAPASGATVPRASFASVHGADAVEARAADLTLDRFLDARLLTPASGAEAGAPDGPAPVHDVLLTGPTGYLGRFLAVEWLERLARSGGRLTCLARAEDDTAARRRVLDCLRAAAGEERADRLVEAAGDRLDVLAADLAEPKLGLDDATWARLAARTDQIVHAAALVNHVLPYRRLFTPNVAATAELIALALTGRPKRFAYVSTIAAAVRPDATLLDEAADIREALPARPLDDSDANGYATSKWAGEVLLREAHELTGLPVTVFRPDMILAHRSLPGRLNLPDRFTRVVLSVLAAGMAPRSFYRLDRDGRRSDRAHYSGLPVDFTAEAITALAAHGAAGFTTFHTVNANDDGISLDGIVDWLIAAGHPIARFDDHREWHMRFEAALRGLPDHQRRLSLLPLLPAYARPGEPRPGSATPAARFTAAVRELGVGGGEVPSLTPEFIGKCVADLRLHGLL
ncbi:carboxylic acid reductase [Kitasatospora sp. A2-31]|uniref:carboxylic acid reductase n=1 Tax=Kitasatospora sp. A2-31 TaxID=2916414 RepID=UPI001EEB49F2|nr:carboxylic acid reductase [Kitasatospora sp. A2-31]MCG6497797.1 thioester reductase domain-containing protein [Kitasatospora sp. A2-31]